MGYETGRAVFLDGKVEGAQHSEGADQSPGEGLWNRLQELQRFDAKSMRKSNDINQADVAFSPLYAPNVVPMKARQLRKSFLRQMALDPQVANAFAKYLSRIELSHQPSCCNVNTMSSTHYECDITA